MDFQVSDSRHGKRDPNKVFITTELHTQILQTEAHDWTSLFQEFRLNLQSRIVNLSDDRELHKLQGKLEFVNELEKIFLDMLRPQS